MDLTLSECIKFEIPSFKKYRTTDTYKNGKLSHRRLEWRCIEEIFFFFKKSLV